ncbi:hypothetical protein FRC14_006199 [Serendipita sp. 396]|nr:hypothetical protein FRC14_006199 [Serendipita sp. 396]KAG8864693.1 hypothetical protein FRC20_010133 [Serendipita sp. 405]
MATLKLAAVCLLHPGSTLLNTTIRAVGSPSQVVFSPNTRNPSSGGVIVNPASSSSSPGSSGPFAQPLAASSGPGSPNHDVSSSNQTSTFGVASRLGQSAAPQATIVSPSGSVNLSGAAS